MAALSLLRRRGAALALPAALGAVQAAPLLTFVPPLKPLWPRVNGAGRTDHVALTFDDGPDSASTPAFLDLLAERGVRATFFLLGTMAVRHPGLARRIVDEGHEVAVHSWDHRNHLRHLPGPATREQLERTVDLLEAQTGVRPRFFRPPYGALTAADLVAARQLGLQTVLWTAWGRDWEEQATPESVAALVGRDLRGGATVLLHDSDCTSSPLSWHATLGAVPLVLDACERLGLAVGTVGEHGLTPPPIAA
ncbi:peptidoglycan/xylan/chitin deacetylase (PgdA/CDA1 family) [Motilibacter rhizosphaerae]|uniref:Peptidoglycan/xylan/chitin deacetylase (PgdA/CDA1 family) n=1 Tax=Motilibacter rhizosphaerae TaxID=598652 RepID=A0A4Q7NPU4_9ACTN|nr:polysaccharide deacetylase family protein [Motilibacter rhizosphaerae]RZS87344.1 peptidoglycan/xylan/chitin deacetylase (PgdA/CDA1 family) [Motilibacter rhizosphaerae]